MQMLDSFCLVFCCANVSIRQELTCPPYRCLNTARYISQCLSLPGASSSEGACDSPFHPLWPSLGSFAVLWGWSPLSPEGGGPAKTREWVSASPAWHGWCGLASAHHKLVGGSSGHNQGAGHREGMSSIFQLQQQGSCIFNSTCRESSWDQWNTLVSKGPEW